MQKKLFAAILAGVAGVIGVILLMHAKPTGTARAPHRASAPPMARPSVKKPSNRIARPAASDADTLTETSAKSTGEAQPLAWPLPVVPTNASFEIASIPLGDAPLARVNGVDLTASKIFPPGVMRSGDRLPKIALDKFLEEAVNQALVVQEAEKRGYAEDPDFIKQLDEFREDVAGMPNLSPEERAWQFNELREMALMDRVFKEQGIVPQRLGNDEVEAYYQAHSSEYDWVRKREALKGSSPEKAELRVWAEIKKDLQIPIKRQLTQQRDEFTYSLLKQANVELLADAGSDNPD